MRRLILARLLSLSCLLAAAACFPKAEIDEEDDGADFDTDGGVDGDPDDEDDGDPDDEDDGDTDSETDAETDSETDAETDSETDTDGGTDTDTDTAPPFELDDLSPIYGTDAGGQQVTLTGIFPDGTTASFGGQAATVVSNDGASLLVETPAGLGLGDLDVRVEHGDSRLLLEEAYRVWADGAGLAGAAGAVSWTERVGTYWSSSTLTFSDAEVYLVDPVDFHWKDLYSPTMDSCRPGSYSWGSSLEPLDTDFTEVSLEATSHDFDLAWDGSRECFENDELTSSEWAERTSYDLVVPENDLLPAGTISDFVRTGTVPDLLEPDIAGSEPPDIEEDPVFEWTPSGADWIEIQLALWDSAGSGYQESMYCIVTDDGYYRVDSGQLSEWPEDRQVDIYFRAALESSATLPWNGADSRVVGISAVYGAGFVVD